MKVIEVKRRLAEEAQRLRVLTTDLESANIIRNEVVRAQAIRSIREQLGNTIKQLQYLSEQEISVRK